MTIIVAAILLGCLISHGLWGIASAIGNLAIVDEAKKGEED